MYLSTEVGLCIGWVEPIQYVSTIHLTNTAGIIDMYRSEKQSKYTSIWFELGQIFKYFAIIMMTSSNGNIFRITGHLCGEFTGPRWIPHTKASDAELWYLFWSASE